ncbi:hypothetical protein GALMADRAFT_255724 [Galerina marginata CBS 339.88]|uniref:Crinkler effector protein N-terminal domain-containing protein n=1 Tax=Galerina marginata (strain CBS 339.88) TaxID=685588 RepID=A0A067SG14_GALM3|nr:hypothetical protein GALMADRAFT_255724 [Galerina marginata CBS 339.88]
MAVEKLRLTYLLWPDDNPNEHVVVLYVDSNKIISSLKTLIKQDEFHRLAHVESRDLVLWKCSGLSDDDDLGPTLESVRFDGSDHRLVRLSNVHHKISQHFGDGDISNEPFDILVEVPTPDQPSDLHDQTKDEDKEEEEKYNQITDLILTTRRKFKRTIEKNYNSPPPSTSAKSGGYITFQNDRDPIYDGRYVAANPAETRAPPIQLYHPAFGHFLDESTNKDLQVPLNVVRATARFMGDASGIFKDEAMRRSTIRPKLLAVLSMGMEKSTNLDSTSANGMVITRALMMGEVAAIGIEEDKNKFGDGGSDPSTQAGFSYGRYWAQPNHANIRQNSCCPSFLIAIAGTSIAILGAVWTDKIIVQRLTDYIWHGHGSIFNDETIYRNARILYALGKSLHRLEVFYQSLQVQTQPPIPKKLEPRYFPSINAYCGPDDTIISFTWVVPLELDSVCTTYLAKTNGPASELIVVKFVLRYNKDAHELLAENGMAPKLRYCGKVGIRDGDPSYGPLCMIVMDFVDGETLDKTSNYPPMLSQRIREILAILHQADYVFGDLRGPNVMITKNNEVMFIDFDMVGKHGESIYPIMMSPSIQWADGVADGLCVMLKEHDLHMLKQFVPGACAHGWS